MIDPISPNLSSDTERTALTLSLQQQIADTVQGGLQVVYSKSESFTTESGESYRVILDEADPANPTGQTLRIAGDLFPAVNAGLKAPVQNFGEPEELTISGSLNWELPYRDWQLDMEVSHSASEQVTRRTNTDRIIDFGNFLSGLQPLVASGEFNPFDLLANDPAVFSAEGGVFGNNSIAGSESEVNTFTAYIEGEAFDLPGGESRFVLGGEYRDESLTGFSGDFFNDPLETFRSDPGRDIKAMFGELAVPVIGDENALPGIQELNIKVAARWEDYTLDGTVLEAGQQQPTSVSTSFTHTSPNVSLSWQIVDDLQINASWGESFRAPSPNDIFLDLRLGSSSIPVFDPLAPGGAATVFVPRFSSGNSTLKPEISTNKTLTISWQPSYIPGLSTRISYSEIDFADRITTVLVGFDPVTQARNLSDPFLGPLLTERDPDGNLLRVFSLPVNFASSLSESIDFNIDYAFDTDIGSFYARLQGTATLDRFDKSGPESNPRDLLANDQGVSDKLVGSASLDWQRDNYGAAIIYNHASSYADLGLDFATRQLVEQGRVEGISNWDLTGYYTTDNGWRISGGARNVFNERPATFAVGNQPFDARRANVRGRVLFAEVTKSLDW